MTDYPRENVERYKDPTAYAALSEYDRDIDRANYASTKLIIAIKCLLDASGFELADRIAIRDKKTGREYR